MRREEEKILHNRDYSEMYLSPMYTYKCEGGKSSPREQLLMLHESCSVIKAHASCTLQNPQSSCDSWKRLGEGREA